MADFESKYTGEEVESQLDKMAGLTDEDGYIYSAGEKVDMRFTRSLLPVGTSIPASANLNTIEFLKIGKYYCSLNADAKTIKNCPVNVAFSMEVFNPLGTNVDDETTRDYTYRLRVLTQYDTGQQYVQFCRTNGTAGSWIYDSWYVTPRVKFALASSKNDGSAAIGATNKGVYVDSTGEIKAMSYTVAKSVPSNAVFTDTDTKVTAVENHYAPAEDESQQIDAPSGEVVTGIKRDAAGHVVGVVSTPQTGGGDGYLGVYGDGYIESQAMEDGTYLTTNVAENLDEVSARGQLADAYDVKTFVENAVQGGGGDPLWYEDLEGRAFCDRDIQVDGNIIANGTVVTGSIGVPAPEGGYRTGDSGQILKADGNGFVAWDDLSIPTKVSDLENDNVYITDFKVEDLELLVSGHLESLQIDGQALADALYEGKRVSVPYSSDMIGGHAILLGEVSDIDINFSVYTHQAKVYYCEALEGVIYYWGIWGRDVTSTVEQTESGDLKKVAMANAVQTDGLIYAFPDQATGEEDDVLLSRGKAKTINGQYLLADENSNDITVAYPEIAATSNAMILQPNTVTVWGGTVAGTISISFALPLQGYVSEYIARFTVAADGVQLIVPDRVVWADGVLPAMTPGKTYEISFLRTSGDNSITATFLEF